MTTSPGSQRSEGGSAQVDILLIVRDPLRRKALRRSLDSETRAVACVGSIGDALARLRTRRYDLVLCAEQQLGTQLEDHYGILIDSTGLLLRNAGGDALYLPGIGIRAHGVLLVPTTDTAYVGTAVSAAVARLERMGWRKLTLVRS